MKKLKEILLLLILFIMSYVLFIVLNFPSPFVAGSDTAFVGGISYLKLLLNDKTFLIATINTIRKPFVSSVVLIPIINTIRKPFISSVVLTPLSCFILKNRIKFTRKSFYLTAFATSFIISIVYLITNAKLYNILGYIFFPMSISFLCLIVFWILELFIDIIKKLRGKGICNEEV